MKVIEVADNRGSNGAGIGQKNMKLVHDWFLANPKREVSECADALNLSERTVRRWVKEINSQHKER